MKCAGARVMMMMMERGDNDRGVRRRLGFFSCLMMQKREGKNFVGGFFWASCSKNKLGSRQLNWRL